MNKIDAHTLPFITRAGFTSAIELGTDRQLQTLDHIYQLLSSDRMNRWMLVLEMMIVLMFLFEIVKSFVG